MNRRMCLVVVLTFLRWTPHVARADLFCELSEALVLFQICHDLSKVYSRVKLGRLGTRIAQEATVVELLHVLHGLLRRELEFP